MGAMQLTREGDFLLLFFFPGFPYIPNLLVLFFSLGFPLQRGRRSMLHIPSLGYSFCQVIRLDPFVFYPDKPIETQITVNHLDTSDKSYVHDASVSWIEDVNSDKFTACEMTAGFNERMSFSNLTVDWLAYQGAPVCGVAGVQRTSQWWTMFGLCLILYSVGFMICILVRIGEVQTESKRTD